MKLQDFKKKIFVIGVYDDPMEAMVERPEGDGELNLFEKTHTDDSPQQEVYQTQIVNNIKMWYAQKIGTALSNRIENSPDSFCICF